MYRTTNIGLAAWLVFCGLEPDWIETDPVTRKLVLFFTPTSVLSEQVHRYRFGDGIEETVIRKYNDIAIRLTSKRRDTASAAVGAGHE